MIIAGIGSRDLPHAGHEICFKLGAFLARQGHTLVSGNALGADQAFASGANQENPSLVQLMLPWWNYERAAVKPTNQVIVVDDLPYSGEAFSYYKELAKRHHSAWSKLSQGAQKLMIRNGMILRPPVQGRVEEGRSSWMVGKPVDLVLAWPREGAHQGGTGQGLRVAQELGVPWILLNKASREELFNLCERLAGRKVLS